MRAAHKCWDDATPIGRDYKYIRGIGPLPVMGGLSRLIRLAASAFYPPVWTRPVLT
jgi:hypothetical protein